MTEWREFRERLFGDPYLVWHDGPDFSKLLREAQTDIATIEAMLPLGLKDEDYVAAMSYEELAKHGHHLDSAIPTLTKALPKSKGRSKIAIAKALYTLTSNEEWSEPIVKVLHQARSEFDRLDAAIALADFPPASMRVAALAKAVQDKDYLVRYHASATLLTYAGRRKQDLPKRIFDKISSDTNRVLWSEAAGMLVRMQK